MTINTHPVDLFSPEERTRIQRTAAEQQGKELAALAKAQQAQAA